MGYTTEFKGRFNLDKPLTPEHVQEFAKWARDEWPNAPVRGYNQWRPTADGMGIEWDQEEKFYDWKEWLQYWIDDVLTPRGYTLTGSVEWEGEGGLDVGLLVIENGKAKCRPLPVKPFAEFPESAKRLVIECLEREIREVYRDEHKACFVSALAALGSPVQSDRVTYDP